MKNIVTINFNSKLDNISHVDSLIEELKFNYQLKDEIYNNILLATHEAVNNAIAHGNNLDINKKVSVSIFVNQNNIKICVEDGGEGFDLDKIEDPTLPENKLEPDGRGVFLMKQLADDIVFENNGTCVEMYFKYQ